MAEPKYNIKKKMYLRSDKITEHLAKCAMYCDSLGESKYNHWIEHELANWISEVNDLVSKPDGKKLKLKFYEDILFRGLGDSRADAKANLTDLEIYNSRSANPYPKVNIDQEMIDRMFKISEAMISKIAPILSTKNSLNKADFEVLLHSMLDPICKNAEVTFNTTELR